MTKTQKRAEENRHAYPTKILNGPSGPDPYGRRSSGARFHFPIYDIYFVTMKATKQKHPGFSFVRSSGGIHEYTLNKNGLSVLVKEDHSVPVVTFMVTYRVGSRNEVVGNTGSTHILEHMMFKVSKNYPRDHARTFLEKGARQNATTWLDRTNYFHTLPVEYLEDNIGYEADRMRGALFLKKDLDTEMVVVRNEYERGENDPHQALDKEIWATAFQAHPYHHSTIGWKSDIENSTVESLKKFYDTFYWPNNVTVTIIGDVETGKALSLVKKYFEKVSRSPNPIPPMLMKEPKQEGPRRLVVSRPGETNIVGIGHKIPPALHEDTHSMQVLGTILASGKSSRLYRKLVDGGLATSVSVFGLPFHDEGLSVTYARLVRGVKHEQVEKVILSEYKQIKKSGVTKSEIKKAQAKIMCEFSFLGDGSYAVAGSLNETIAMGDWTFYTEFLGKIAKVGAGDIKRVANQYLVEHNSTTGYFVASKDVSHIKV